MGSKCQNCGQDEISLETDNGNAWCHECGWVRHDADISAETEAEIGRLRAATHRVMADGREYFRGTREECWRVVRKEWVGPSANGGMKDDLVYECWPTGVSWQVVALEAGR